MDMVVALVKSMRPKQWAKNVFVLAALVFDAKLFMPTFFARAFAAFCLFCAISSAVYLINDVADMEKDRQHPGKRNRPLASGQLSPNIAVMTAVVIVAVALPLAYLLDPAFAAIAVGYLAIITLYSFWLKNVVLLDVIIVAAGLYWSPHDTKMNIKLKMRVNFMDWKKGDIVELPKERADQYLRLKVCEINKAAKAPRNKMVTGAKNK